MNDKNQGPGPAAPLPAGLESLGPLSAAEAEIVAHLQQGHLNRLGGGSRPEEADPARTVRAEFLRLLILGEGGYLPHQKGLRLSGAWISGILDLESCRIPRDIALKDCHFEASPVLRSAIMDNLFLDGSRLPGLQADRLEARGCFSLKGAAVSGPIRLQGGRIGGSVEADGVSLAAPEDVALDVEGLEARGSILLRGAQIVGGVNLSSVRLGGEINVVGATIEHAQDVAINGDAVKLQGDLALRGAAVSGETRFIGARFGGDVDCKAATFTNPEGFALRLNQAVIAGAFVLRENARVDGVMDLTAATIGAIDDDPASWPQAGNLLLNRCQYGAFIGGPVDAKSRLDWLSRQAPERWNSDFWPQPYRHLSMVFDELGHDEDALTVLIAKERLQRRARRRRAGNPLMLAALAVRDSILNITVRYGRRPLYAMLWILLFWVTGAVVFAFAYNAGAMKPNVPFVLRSPEWTMCNVPDTESRYMPSFGQVMNGRARPGETQLSCFRNQPEAGSYPEFNSVMYSLDVLLPVLSIGQKDYWRPDSAKPTGAFALRYYFFQSVIGWALGLLAVAGFSGMVKSR
jgi:hypothetical protein